MRSVEGVEEDWPLTYHELSPFYSHVEKMIGVTGARSPGDCAGLRIFTRAKIPLFGADRQAHMRQARNTDDRRTQGVLTEPYDNRPPCHYSGRCMDGCDVGALFSVPDSMLPKARRTGKFTLIPNKLRCRRSRRQRIRLKRRPSRVQPSPCLIPPACRQNPIASRNQRLAGSSLPADCVV